MFGLGRRKTVEAREKAQAPSPGDSIFECQFVGEIAGTPRLEEGNNVRLWITVRTSVFGLSTSDQHLVAVVAVNNEAAARKLASELKPSDAVRVHGALCAIPVIDGEPGLMVNAMGLDRLGL